VFEPEPPRTISFEGMTWSLRQLPSSTALFDLTLTVGVEPEGLRCGIEYNADLFEPATIGRMAGHLQALLAGVAANPALRLTQIPLLTPAERQQTVVDWNTTKADFNLERCIQHLFEDQPTERPDHPALAFAPG